MLPALFLRARLVPCAAGAANKMQQQRHIQPAPRPLVARVVLLMYSVNQQQHSGETESSSKAAAAVTATATGPASDECLTSELVDVAAAAPRKRTGIVC